MPEPSYFKNRRVMVRADLNVDTVGNRIIDDYRILRSLPTIRFVAKQARYTVIVSHRGSFEKRNDPSQSLFLVARRLSRLLGQKVYFLDGSLRSIELALSAVPSHAIVLLENIRWYDGEKENSVALARQLSRLADVFINDAFGESHRSVASLCAITGFLPSFAGLLLADEMNKLNSFDGNFGRPFVVLLGGAKLKTKLPLIKRFIKQADYLLIGTALANTFFAAKAIKIGVSLNEKEFIGQARQMLKNKKLIIPGDYLVARGFAQGKGRVSTGNIGPDSMIVDIGPQTIRRFTEILSSARVIFWNGPVGCFEHKPFAKGSRAVLSAVLKNTKAIKIVGGGDTLELLGKKKLNLGRTSFVSTGGGAMLAYLSGQKMPGIEALKR